MYTKEFVEKVSKAKEIQALCKYEKGDWFYNGEKPVVFCKAGIDDLQEPGYNKLLINVINLLKSLEAENKALKPYKKMWTNLAKKHKTDWVGHFEIEELENKYLGGKK
jgi:hypothetical protein